MLKKFAISMIGPTLMLAIIITGGLTIWLLSVILSNPISLAVLVGAVLITFAILARKRG